LHSPPSLLLLLSFLLSFFFFNDTATPEIYTLSLHDALPIYPAGAAMLRLALQALTLLRDHARRPRVRHHAEGVARLGHAFEAERSEEHTSELQSRGHLVCRLLLEKKKKKNKNRYT